MTTYININGDVRDTSALTVPADRTFRGAWEYNGSAVEIDMTAAKAIHKDNLRAERGPLLDALDVEYMKALEAGTGASAIATEKAALRNITDDARIDACTTPEQLIALDVAALLA
jgi:hypothetical protein